jgi:hypothetical protein
VWQGLYGELKGRNFMVVAVAMDTADAARPWIEQAQPGYVCLIDEGHTVAALYNMVNVPQAVWIDEAGRIVRPVESAGAYEGFRQMDRQTRQMPPDVAATTANAKRTYVAAIRDWVENGENSRHVLSPAEAAKRLTLPDARVEQAHAEFRLGQVLLAGGDEARAAAAFGRARELHPDSWNIWRQTYPKNEMGLAAGPEFWARVDALGERRYYEPVAMDGMPG